MSRLDAGLYGIRISHPEMRRVCWDFFHVTVSLIWGYYRQGSSPLKVRSHRWKDMPFQHDTMGKGCTLTQMFSPSSNTSSSMKLSPKTRTGDITSQNGRMRDALSGKKGKRKRAEPSGGVLCNSNIVAKAVYLRHDHCH